MRTYRDQGPTYPMLVTTEFAYITFIEQVGTDDETIISCAPDKLAEGFAHQQN